MPKAMSLLPSCTRLSRVTCFSWDFWESKGCRSANLPSQSTISRPLVHSTVGLLLVYELVVAVVGVGDDGKKTCCVWQQSLCSRRSPPCSCCGCCCCCCCAGSALLLQVDAASVADAELPQAAHAHWHAPIMCDAAVGGGVETYESTAVSEVDHLGFAVCASEPEDVRKSCAHLERKLPPNRREGEWPDPTLFDRFETRRPAAGEEKGNGSAVLLTEYASAWSCCSARQSHCEAAGEGCALAEGRGDILVLLLFVGGEERRVRVSEWMWCGVSERGGTVPVPARVRCVHCGRMCSVHAARAKYMFCNGEAESACA